MVHSLVNSSVGHSGNTSATLTPSGTPSRSPFKSHTEAVDLRTLRDSGTAHDSVSTPLGLSESLVFIGPLRHHLSSHLCVYFKMVGAWGFLMKVWGGPCVRCGYYDSHSGTHEKGFELEWLHRTWRGVTSHPLMFTSGGAKPF